MAVVHRRFNRNKRKYFGLRLMQVISALLGLVPAGWGIAAVHSRSIAAGLLWVVIGALAAAGGSYVCAKRAAILKSGIQGEENTVKMLRALPNSWHILANPVFTVRGRQAELDVLLIGTSGVWIVETKNHSGVITGTPKQEYWRQEKRSQEKQMKNPLLQIERQQRIVQELISGLGRKLPVRTAVYFANPSAKPMVHDPRIFTQEADLLQAIIRDRHSVCKDPAAIAKTLLAQSR